MWQNGFRSAWQIHNRINCNFHSYSKLGVLREKATKIETNKAIIIRTTASVDVPALPAFCTYIRNMWDLCVPYPGQKIDLIIGRRYYLTALFSTIILSSTTSFFYQITSTDGLSCYPTTFIHPIFNFKHSAEKLKYPDYSYPGNTNRSDSTVQL